MCFDAGVRHQGYERMQPFTIKNGYKMAKAYQNGLVIDSVGGQSRQDSNYIYQAAPSEPR